MEHMEHRYIEKLTPVPEALRLLEERVSRVGVLGEVPVWDSVGLVAASDIVAPHDWPPRPKSAYDGYAVRHTDVPGRLRLVGEALIGRVDVGLKVGPGEAAYVTTGAYLPEGADAVVPEEDVKVEGDYIVVEREVEKWANVDPPGSIVARGQVLLEEGTVISPPDVVGLLDVGVTSVRVYRPVRLSIVSTGDELFTPSDPAEARERILKGEVAATTGDLLLWFMSTYMPWVEVVDTALLPDERRAVAWVVRRLLERSDIVLLTGGSGPSNIDLFYQLKSELGGDLIFRGLYVKGGRPTSAYIVEGKPVIGLSGYPLSALHAFIRLVYPLLKYMGRVKRAHPPLPLVEARLAEPLKAGRPRPIKVRVERRGGEYWAYPLESRLQLTSAIVGLSMADGILFTGDKPMERGEKALVLLYKEHRGEPLHPT
ncbi:MAG: molybdopterin molybdotransferase MoeA [Desulfurococcales archaeon]|nr:molybdopterin molybdotransferase MoeA [Desulfurococcales archaeon]